METFSLEDGQELVKAARHAIEQHATHRKVNRHEIDKRIAKFNHEYGVFVTIEHYPTNTLRGCIGFPRPIGPLRISLIDAAIAASSEDPRFVPVSHMEFEDMIVEVSILSALERIKGKAAETKKREVKVGRDGLVIQYGYNSGLLLPIVAVEQEWSATKFLENVCLKAGLPAHYWRRDDVFLYKFTTQVFREVSPRGHVEEILLS
ncbi:MAG: TIGR00296 family protein [Candidatus Micrarchaeota archaeon]|nr:TIGR00296 family protein [Candidatus Micrarchaeota archaeon]